ncbi:MAG: polyamine ABC transporter permease [Magnetovibrio sp.]|nr:polyamine ABC transporter permease [Magnetovibrio sp.]|tara:strand:- start:142 stop:945 length:804 start_codon:yes stop_codon:yes gene_type:complete
MDPRPITKWMFYGYIAIVFSFIFLPIIASVVFSFNSQRFPTVPLGTFSTVWYETILTDSDVWDAAKTSIIVALCTSVIATFIGFCTAYADYRYRFFGKSGFLALALLPPTIPLIIMALAMLAWFARMGISGQVWSVIAAHTVLTIPFAMAIIRLRLNDIDPQLEAAAWNLGATEWVAVRNIILPFSKPAIIASLCLTAAVSFDEFAVAWFVAGLNKTIPVLIMEIVTGNIDPQVNAIGSFVFLTSMTLVVLAQLLLMKRLGRKWRGR